MGAGQPAAATSSLPRLAGQQQGAPVAAGLRCPSRAHPRGFATNQQRASPRGGGCRNAIPKANLRILPERIILVRHAESEGNVCNSVYTQVPDPQVPLVGARPLPPLHLPPRGAGWRRPQDEHTPSPHRLHLTLQQALGAA